MNTKSFHLSREVVKNVCRQSFYTDKQTDAPKFWEQRLVRAGNNYVVMKYVLTNHLRTFLITSSAFFASSSSSSSSSPLLLFLITAALSLSTSAPYVLTNHLRTFLITPSAFFASSPSSSSSSSSSSLLILLGCSSSISLHFTRFLFKNRQFGNVIRAHTKNAVNIMFLINPYSFIVHPITNESTIEKNMIHAVICSTNFCPSKSTIFSRSSSFGKCTRLYQKKLN